jgi:hypothetical protein
MRFPWAVGIQFSCSPIFDFSGLHTLSAPNKSNFEICADNDSWYTSTHTKLTQFSPAERQTRNGTIVPQYTNILLIFLRLPPAIWSDYRVGNAFEIAMPPSIVMSAVYVYVFLAALALFRGLLSYSRWVFPKVDPDSELSSRFRRSGVLGQYFWLLWGHFFMTCSSTFSHRTGTARVGQCVPALRR